jgi:hypothetical protein
VENAVDFLAPDYFDERRLITIFFAMASSEASLKLS